MTRRVATIATAIVTTAVIAGCQSEPPEPVRDDQPAPVQESVMGANARIGSILLRSVHIEAPQDPRYEPGDDAKVWFTLVNEGLEEDVLTAVSSPAAERAEIRWDSDCDGQAQAVPRLPLRPAAPRPVDPPVAVPPFDAYHAWLIDLNRLVLAGTTVPVTFTFERAGSVTVETFVQPSNAPRAEPSTRCLDSGPSATPGPAPSSRRG